MRAIGVYFFLLFPVPLFAQVMPDPCDWETEDRLVGGLCDCRETENDIERLLCYDQLTSLEIALRRVMLDKALQLAETKEGRAAMHEVLGSRPNFEGNP